MPRLSAGHTAKAKKAKPTPRPSGESRDTIEAAVRRARGVLKSQPGQKPLLDEWAAHKADERKLEDRKLARLRPR